MINHFLSNPFLNSPLGHKRFAQYAQSHLELVRGANTDGQFDALLAPTEAAHQALVRALGTTASAKARGQGKRLTNDEAVAKLKRFISRKAGVLADLFASPDGTVRGEDTPQYKAFYPQGVSEYSRADKADILVLAERFAREAQAQAAKVGAQLEQDVRALMAQTDTSRTEQLREAGTAEDGSQQGEKERAALAVQLFANLLALLQHHKTDPETVAGYFNQGLLRRRRPGADN